MRKHYTHEDLEQMFKYIREEKEFTTREFMVNFSERFVSQGAASSVLYRFMMNLTGLFPHSELESIWPSTLPKQHHKKYRDVIKSAGIKLPTPILKDSRSKSKTISSVSNESRKNKTNDSDWNFSEWGVEDDLSPQDQLKAAGFRLTGEGWVHKDSDVFAIVNATGKYRRIYGDNKHRVIRKPSEYKERSFLINRVLQENNYPTGPCIGTHGINGLNFNDLTIREMIERTKHLNECAERMKSALDEFSNVIFN